MADRLWEDFLQRAEQCLALPQFAVVLSGLAETAAGLAELWHSHQPVMQHQTGVWPVLLAAGLDATAASTRTMSLP